MGETASTLIPEYNTSNTPKYSGYTLIYSGYTIILLRF